MRLSWNEIRVRANEWKAVAGPDYWQFEDETLTDRRLRLEEEAVDD